MKCYPVIQIIVAFFMINIHSLYGQYWSKRFDLQNGNEYGMQVALANDGLIVSVKGLCDYNTRFCQGFIKVDFAGNLLWKKITLYDTLTTNHTEGMALREDTIFLNVNYLISPLLYSIIAFDLQGNYLSRLDYDISGGLEGTHWARDISTGGDRLFVAYQYDNLNESPRIRVRAFEHDWTEAWDIGVPGNSVAFFCDIEATKDSGLATIHTICYPCRAYVRKLDADGELIWQTQIPGMFPSLFSQVAHLALHPDGGYVGSWPIDTFEAGVYPWPSLVFKLDSLGTLQWQKVSITPLNHDYYQIFSAHNGDIVVCGMDTNLTTPNSDSSDYYAGYVRRFTPEGEIRWERRIFDLTQGAQFGFFLDGIELDDGSLVFCGQIEDTIPDDPYPDNVWLVRLDSLGCLSPGCGFNQFVADSHEPGRPAAEEVFVVFPVPFQERLHLAAILGRHIPPGAYRVALYDAAGRLVLEQPFDPRLLTTLETGLTPPGAYVLNVLRDGRAVQSLKVMKW